MTLKFPSILMIIGTILLASEAFGKDRIAQWESKLKYLLSKLNDFLLAVVLWDYMGFKLHNTKRLRIRKMMKGLVENFVFIKMIPSLAWVALYFIWKDVSHKAIWVYFSFAVCVFSLYIITYLILRNYNRDFEKSKRSRFIKSLYAFTVKCASKVSNILELITLFLALTFALPLILLYFLGLIFFLITWLPTKLLHLKDNLKMGNLFIIIGLLISITAIVLQMLEN